MFIFADVTIGAGDGGGPRVQTYSGEDLLTNVKVNIANFFAATVTGSENNRGGSRVAVKDMDGDSKLDIIVSPGLERQRQDRRVLRQQSESHSAGRRPGIG